MPLLNLNDTHLSEEQKQEIHSLIDQLEGALAPKNVNLTAEERRKYGSISEQNKLFVNKVYDYAKSQPNLKSPDVQWDEFFADVESRNFIEAVLSKLENISTRLRNAKTLHDYDNFQASLDDYAYTSYKAGTSAAGYEIKLKDLKQFFQRERKKEEDNKEETPKNEETVE